MKKIILLIFFFTFYCLLFIAYGQNRNIDSLLKIVNSPSNIISDTSKVNTLNKLSTQYEIIGEYTKGLQYGNQGLILAQKIKYKKGAANSFNEIGLIDDDKGDLDIALENYLKSLKINQEIGNKKGIASNYNNIGLIYDEQSNYPKALDYYFKSLKIKQELNDKKGIASNYNNIGIIYDEQYNYPKALDYFFKCLKINEASDNKEEMGKVFNNIANIYKEQSDYSKSLDYYYKSLKIGEALGIKKGIACSYINIGTIYELQQKYSEAMQNFITALEISKELGVKTIEATSYSCIAIIFKDQGNYEESTKNDLESIKMYEQMEDNMDIANPINDIGTNYHNQHNDLEALNYYFKALKIIEKIGFKKGISAININIGQSYLILKKTKDAKKYIDKGLEVAKEINEKEWIRNGYESLTQIDSANNDWKSAYEHHKTYLAAKESFTKDLDNKKVMRVQMQYEYDKKTIADSVKAGEEKKVISSELKQEQTKSYALYGGLALLLVFGGFMFNRFRVTQKQKNIIGEQKKEVEKKNKIVETKNKEITQSIEYALRIQTAILPPQKIVKQYLENSFILYKPKDIVAGDFYWMENPSPSERGRGEAILFAACDCTGHGVPGAMVSVVCHNALNRAVREFGLTQPAAILDKTAEIVIENFSKSEEDIKDGMDISLCCLTPTLSASSASGTFSEGEGKRKQFYGEGEGTYTLQWAGANNPLWLVRNTPLSFGEGQGVRLEETKADKQPIGKDENSKPFTNHTFQLNTGDTIYLFTDGFADQFGGETGEKKLTRKRFKDLILSIQNKSMQEQGIALDKFISEYRKSVEQIDDVLVMGVRV